MHMESRLYPNYEFTLLKSHHNYFLNLLNVFVFMRKAHSWDMFIHMTNVIAFINDKRLTNKVKLDIPYLALKLNIMDRPKLKV
jgi:hypothetical protein